MHQMSTTNNLLRLTNPVDERRFKSLKPLDISTCTKDQICTYFEETIDLEENIFACLKDTSCFLLSPNKFRLPIIFYFGHTPTIFINKLFISGFIKERINFEFETLFESGVDEMSWDSTDSQRMGSKLHWPPIESIFDYRRKVRDLVLKTIDTTPLELPITWESPWWSLILGIDHVRIHFELSCVMFRELPVDLVEHPRSWSYAPNEPKTPIGENKLIKVPAGVVTLGMPRDFPAYGWDVSFGKEQREVPAFKAAKYLTTNAEFLSFVQAGGYEKEEYWTKEGWEWVSNAKPRHPHFWVCRHGCESICDGALSNHTHCQHFATRTVESSNGGTWEYLYRAMFDELDMPWSWPVEVNYHEAKAYCNWRGDSFRLPTEAEKIRIRGEELPPEEGLISDPAFADFPPFNLNLQYCSSTPVNHFPPSSLGFYDTYGNLWEWTECHHNALEGFKTHKLYDNYSTPAFDGEHNVLVGGCWTSSGSYASRFYRNAFRRHFFQHSGFRVVEGLDKKKCSSRSYTPGEGFVDNCVTVFDSASQCLIRESANKQLKTELNEAFQQEIKSDQSDTDVLLQHIPLYDICHDSVTHVGCGTGRACFILSRTFSYVLGIDYSGRFIEFCDEVRRNSEKTGWDGFEIPDNIVRDRLTFKQFSWLPNEIPASDLILVTLLDRVMNPEAWTVRLFEIVKSSGTVIVVSKIPLENLERIMNKLHLKTSETPFADPKQSLSIWKRN